MISTYQIPATDGEHVIPHNSAAMDRMVSISYHQTPTAGNIDVLARPFGRSDYLSVDGAAGIPATSEKTFTVSYPMTDMKIVLSGMANGTLINVTVADGVA